MVEWEKSQTEALEAQPVRWKRGMKGGIGMRWGGGKRGKGKIQWYEALNFA